ncbi:hypothetical protein [Nocardia vaccinii]|uniref:hypothetical protein n=1 Tax=Nocardia vaccinii TaxID=1822 RepID=UPI000B1CAFD9|nr:hypothetical protein [Nocardia vaccinii]
MSGVQSVTSVELGAPAPSVALVAALVPPPNTVRSTLATRPRYAQSAGMVTIVNVAIAAQMHHAPARPFTSAQAHRA